uniref:UDENN domain-containing protein n=1 Tax=Macrostomum lignano TaxID=282301 RepID=A0A1I8FII4_9PLAT
SIFGSLKVETKNGGGLVLIERKLYVVSFGDKSRGNVLAHLVLLPNCKATATYRYLCWLGLLDQMVLTSGLLSRWLQHSLWLQPGRTGLVACLINKSSRRTLPAHAQRLLIGVVSLERALRFAGRAASGPHAVRPAASPGHVGRGDVQPAGQLPLLFILDHSLRFRSDDDVNATNASFEAYPMWATFATWLTPYCTRLCAVVVIFTVNPHHSQTATGSAAAPARSSALSGLDETARLASPRPRSKPKPNEFAFAGDWCLEEQEERENEVTRPAGGSSSGCGSRIRELRTLALRQRRHAAASTLAETITYLCMYSNQRREFFSLLRFRSAHPAELRSRLSRLCSCNKEPKSAASAAAPGGGSKYPQRHGSDVPPQQRTAAAESGARSCTDADEAVGATTTSCSGIMESPRTNTSVGRQTDSRVRRIKSPNGSRVRRSRVRRTRVNGSKSTIKSQTGSRVRRIKSQTDQESDDQESDDQESRSKRSEIIKSSDGSESESESDQSQTDQRVRRIKSQTDQESDDQSQIKVRRSRAVRVRSRVQTDQESDRVRRSREEQTDRESDQEGSQTDRTIPKQKLKQKRKTQQTVPTHPGPQDSLARRLGQKAIRLLTVAPT